MRWRIAQVSGLVLEFETPWWPANGAARNMKADPRDGHRQFALGGATDPWRVAQARHRNRADQRGAGSHAKEMAVHRDPKRAGDFGDIPRHLGIYRCRATTTTRPQRQTGRSQSVVAASVLSRGSCRRT